MISQIGDIILIGTSHVSKESVKEIKSSIELYEPKVVAIELDKQRLQSLLSENKGDNKKRRNSFKMIKEIGIGGYLFGVLAGYVQDKIGNSMGIEPGIDMKTGYLEAKDKDIPVALVDVPIKETLKKFSKMGFFKKIGFFTKLVTKSMKKENRDKLQFEVKDGVPDQKAIDTMLGIVQKEIPELYDILIEDRNKYMCKNLIKLSQKYEGEKIICVIGAGHLKGMKEILEKHQKKVETGKVEVVNPTQIKASFIVENS